MSTLKERLQELMAEHNLKTQQQLATFAEVSKGLVGQWFNGSTGLGAKPLLVFQKKTNYSTEWLINGTGNKYRTGTSPNNRQTDELTPAPPLRFWSSNSPLPDDEYVFAPFYKDIEFAGGAGAWEQQDYNGFRLPFGKATLYRKDIKIENVFCATIRGDSMEKLLPDGATIAIDKGDKTIRDGQIYAFRHDDLFRIKYLHRLPSGTIRINSENSAYPDETISSENIEIIGRVFWWSVLV